MKKIILLLILLLFTNFLLAQEKKEVNVSEKVKGEFAKLYPNVKDVKWTKSSEITYGWFLQDGKHIGAMFKADTLYANMIQTEITSLPEAVKNHLDKYYNSYSIIRAGKIHFGSGPIENNYFYAADIKNGTISKRVICYPNGEEFSGSSVLDKK